MRTYSTILLFAVAAIACLVLACDDSSTTPDPPDPVPPPQWSEWRRLPPSFTTYSMWAAAPNNVFAVGPAGTAARWNGTRWVRISVDLLRDIWSVTGIAGGPTVAVGDGGATFRFDGISFRQSPFATSENLRGVWAASPDTFLVVGEAGTLLMGDGVAWSLQPSPVNRSMLAIWGTSMRDVFVVGPAGNIVHFDAVAWTEQASGTTETLSSVSGSAPDDVYAVGTLGTILHYDGTNWSPMTSSTNDVLQCVVAHEGSPIAVGANGTALELSGGSWSAIDLATSQWLYGACRAGGSTWVGGARVIRAHDGVAWESEAPGAVPVLRGVCSDPSGSIVVVGDNGYLAQGRGDDWIVEESVGTRDLHCVFRTESGEWFVGGVQRLLHYDGDQWVVEDDDVVTWRGFGESPTELYAVGSGGELRRRVGQSWVDVVGPRINEGLNAVACLSSSEGYAVGEFGVVLRGDGIGWTIIASLSNANIRDVIAHPGDYPNRRALAVGDAGALFVINATRVTALESPTSANLYALVRAPDGDILAFGGGAAMLRYRDGAWQAETSPVLQPIFAAWTQGDEIFAVGGGVAGGIALRFGPP